jgi:hypothetical protein
VALGEHFLLGNRVAPIMLLDLKNDDARISPAGWRWSASFGEAAASIFLE